MSWTTAFGYDNYVTRSDTWLDATSAETTLPVTNLQVDQGDTGSAWQTLAGVTTATLTVSPALVGLPWRVMSLHRTNLTSAASITFQLYNNPSTLVFSQALSGPADGSGQVICVAPADQIADYLRVTIADPGNPLACLSTALAYTGPVWIPASGIAAGTTHARDANEVPFVSRGGQEYPIPTFQQRRWNVELTGIRASEAWANLDVLMKFAALADNILVIPNTVSATLTSEVVFGMFKKTSDVGFADTTGDRRTFHASSTERL